MVQHAVMWCKIVQNGLTSQAGLHANAGWGTLGMGSLAAPPRRQSWICPHTMQVKPHKGPSSVMWPTLPMPQGLHMTPP